MKKHGFVLMLLIVAAWRTDSVARMKVVYPNLHGLGRSLLGYATLKIALEHSGTDFDLQLTDESVNDSRARAMLAAGQISIVDFGTSRKFEEQFLPVYFPIDLGLNGWRVFIIHRDNQKRFAAIETIGDLQKMTAGQGVGWADVNILENAGLRVDTAPNLDNLFRMVEAKRFDYFPLNADRAHSLFDRYRELRPNALVDSQILLIYPFGRLFFVHPDNRKLHDTVKRGLVKALESGRYWAWYKSRPRSRGLFNRARLKHRRQIIIDNPGLSEGFKAIPQKYFFNLGMLD
jgi:hypothetical protein